MLLSLEDQDNWRITYEGYSGKDQFKYLFKSRIRKFVRVRRAEQKLEIIGHASNPVCERKRRKRRGQAFKRAAVSTDTGPLSSRYHGSRATKVIYLAEITDNYFSPPFLATNHHVPSETSSPLTLITPQREGIGGQLGQVEGQDRRYPKRGCLFFDNAAPVYVARIPRGKEEGEGCSPSLSRFLHDRIKINPWNWLARLFIRRLDARINRLMNCHARFTCHLPFGYKKIYLTGG